MLLTECKETDFELLESEGDALVRKTGVERAQQRTKVDEEVCEGLLVDDLLVQI